MSKTIRVIPKNNTRLPKDRERLLVKGQTYDVEEELLQDSCQDLKECFTILSPVTKVVSAANSANNESTPASESAVVTESKASKTSKGANN